MTQSKSESQLAFITDVSEIYSGHRLQDIGPGEHGGEKQAYCSQGSDIANRNIHGILLYLSCNRQPEDFLLLFIICSFYVLFFVKSMGKMH